MKNRNQKMKTENQKKKTENQKLKRKTEANILDNISLFSTNIPTFTNIF